MRDWRRQWIGMDMYDQIGPAGLGSRERIFGNVATGQWMDKQANGPREWMSVLWPGVCPAQVRSRRKYVTAPDWLTCDYISLWALKGKRSNGQGRGGGVQGRVSETRSGRGAGVEEGKKQRAFAGGRSWEGKHADTSCKRLGSTMNGSLGRSPRTAWYPGMGACLCV